jgi:hypothetical protein
MSPATETRRETFERHARECLDLVTHSFDPMLRPPSPPWRLHGWNEHKNYRPSPDGRLGWRALSLRSLAHHPALRSRSLTTRSWGSAVLLS